MESIKPTSEELQHYMKHPKYIRNVCILAHVDHGKTTLCDALLSTNRLISKRLAGTVRYLDDRQDEQERGITMKSSAVSLLNVIKDDDMKDIPILLNLIDTPGHIDFSSEVGAALRVIDGAVVLVDLAEGVCVQTRECIKKAMQEKAQMILVLNKFDRLIVEMKLDTEEIFNYILRAIESCNVVVAEMYQIEYPDVNVDVEDSGFLFSPDAGNVIFASAIHGWGFTLQHLAKLFLPLINDETVESLNSKLWNFDCYVDNKKQVKLGAISKGKDNLFKQFCIKTIMTIYEIIVVRMDKTKVSNILQKLGITTTTKDMLHTDPKIQIKAIMQTWKPIAETILLQCFNIFKNPSVMLENKANYLLNITRHSGDPNALKCIENIKPHLLQSSSSSETVAYVSKMYCIDKKNLGGSKIVMPSSRKDALEKQLHKMNINDEATPEVPIIKESNIQVIALARVFTGTLKIGQEIYVLPPNYKPGDKNTEKVVINDLYMLFGKDLMSVREVPPGNFCGVSGLENTVLRTATLSSTLNMVPFFESPAMEPVIRNSIEPVNTKDLPVLREGLKLLMQSDSCVQILIQENGEMVLLTAGDVHLAKCIEDLTKKFAKIEVNVSSPMVALREAVLGGDTDDFLSNIDNYINVKNENFELNLIAIEVPPSIMKVLEGNYHLLRDIEDSKKKSLIDIVNLLSNEDKSAKNEDTYFKLIEASIKHFKESLSSALVDTESIWRKLDDKIWSIGRNSQSINILVNNVSDFKHSIFVSIENNDKRLFFDQCIVNAFDTVCKAGPICDEPLMNVAFVIKDFKLFDDINIEDISPQFTSNIEGLVRSALRKAFDKRERRLLEPMFTTDIQVNTNILGKVYSVVSKRNGKVLDAVGMDEEEKTYLVKAQIPVIESIGFANEIRTTTSGQANPNLKFSHYEVIDGDPYYEPVEGDDDEDEDLNVESALRASRIRKDVRTRKGLYVEDEVVTHAEKQRTLNKKK
ncbi:unnamed protein product [Brassicogethes aeneus]|uniref:Tr-type G domain-containing protein n=1 Tax=Brassicogethes aeneus TaxID=1431903 RepID=A0A9P0BL12_BRAAE|nr:unnamed protein product [Brassicogethes aeneus]